MNFPTPKTTLGRGIERFFITGLIGALVDLLSQMHVIGEQHPEQGFKFLVIYFLIKTAIDALNRNIPNL